MSISLFIIDVIVIVTKTKCKAYIQKESSVEEELDKIIILIKCRNEVF